MPMSAHTIGAAAGGGSVFGILIAGYARRHQIDLSTEEVVAYAGIVSGIIGYLSALGAFALRKWFGPDVPIPNGNGDHPQPQGAAQ